MGTAHDNWLNQGSDGPKELDEEAMEASIEDVSDRYFDHGGADDVVRKLYDAHPALVRVVNTIEFPKDFPQHLITELLVLVNLTADMRAKVDDEYAARTSTYDDPRD